MCECRRLVSLLLQADGFEDLLIRLPDGFFSMMPETKEWIWGELLGAVNQGIEDPAKLAEIAQKLIKGETVVIERIADGTGMLSSGPSLPGVGHACSADEEFQEQMFKKLTKEHGDEEVHEVHL